MIKIGPSLMCGDMGALKEDVIQLDLAGVDFFHFDIMDGTFVPNFTMGPDMMKSVRTHTDKPFDVHLMTVQPDKHIDLFAEAGADLISIHVETTDHLQKTLQQIKAKNLKAGVALNPATPLHSLPYVLDLVDYINIMTVNPGFAGQTFLPLMYRKISELREMIELTGRAIDIQVDGNIGNETIPGVLANGANMLVCGTSSLFKQEQTKEQAVQQLRSFIAHHKHEYINVSYTN